MGTGDDLFQLLYSFRTAARGDSYSIFYKRNWGKEGENQFHDAIVSFQVKHVIFVQEEMRQIKQVT